MNIFCILWTFKLTYQHFLTARITSLPRSHFLSIAAKFVFCSRIAVQLIPSIKKIVQVLFNGVHSMVFTHTQRLLKCKRKKVGALPQKQPFFSAVKHSSCRFVLTSSGPINEQNGIEITLWVWNLACWCHSWCWGSYGACHLSG